MRHCFEMLCVETIEFDCSESLLILVTPSSWNVLLLKSLNLTPSYHSNFCQQASILKKLSLATLLIAGTPTQVFLSGITQFHLPNKIIPSLDYLRYTFSYKLIVFLFCQKIAPGNQKPYLLPSMLHSQCLEESGAIKKYVLNR